MSQGWEEKKLGDLFDITSSKRVFESDWKNTGVPFYRAREIVKLANQGYVDNELYISNEMYELYSSKYGIPKEGDLMVTGVGTLGICYVVKKNDKFYFKDGNIIWLKKKSSVDSRFVEYAFKSDLIRAQIDNSVGATVGTYTIIKAKETKINIPPIEDQKRIVSILDKTFAAINKAKANTERNLQNVRELFESFLGEVFSNYTNNWVNKKLVSITTKIGSGATPRGGKESYKTSGISLVRSMNVHDLFFREKNLAFIDPKQAKDLDNVTLKENDVLLNITGASVARCCVMEKEYLPARVNQHVSIIRANSDIIDPVFLSLLLVSKPYKDQLLFTGEQGATRQAITKAQLEDFEVIYPKSLNEQKAIVEKVYSLKMGTEKTESIYNQRLSALEELRKSILQKAFSGEL